MKFASVLLIVLCVAQPTGLRATRSETIKLSGRLVIVERDNPTDDENPNAPKRSGDTHYAIMGADDTIWGLNFPAGSEPSDSNRTGMSLEVEVLAKEVGATAAALSFGGTRRRLLGHVGNNPRTHHQLVGPQSHRSGRHDPNPHDPSCSRRLGPGSRCGGGEDGEPDKSSQAGDEEGDVDGEGEPRSLPFSRQRAMTEGEHVDENAPAGGGGHLTVVNWRPIVRSDSSSDSGGGDGGAGAKIKPREAYLAGYDYGGFMPERVVMDDVATVVYILDMCDHGPAVSKEDLEAVLFGGEGMTVESYFSYCSSGIAKFTRENVLVLGPVRVPCSGSYIFRDYFGWELETSWGTSSCRPQDYKGWMRYADQWARDSGYDLSAYRHHVAIISPRQGEWMSLGDGLGSDCNWTGLAYIGPISTNQDIYTEYDESLNGGAPMAYTEGRFGYAWVNGEKWDQVATWAHELAHNYYLRHAGMDGCEYCDDTSVMGFCCEVRCFSAPHMWQLGWRDPVEDLGIERLSVGLALKLSLPISPADTPVGSAVRVMAQWTFDVKRSDDPYEAVVFLVPAIWVAYRRGGEPYDHLAPELNGVSLYWILQEDSFAVSLTSKLATLAMGQVWRNESLGLLVSWTRQGTKAGQETAEVTICRFEAAHERGFPACLDGTDNDCDGLVDWEDPDCTQQTGWTDDFGDGGFSGGGGGGFGGKSGPVDGEQPDVMPPDLPPIAPPGTYLPDAQAQLPTYPPYGMWPPLDEAAAPPPGVYVAPVYAPPLWEPGPIPYGDGAGRSRRSLAASVASSQHQHQTLSAGQRTRIVHKAEAEEAAGATSHTEEVGSTRAAGTAAAAAVRSAALSTTEQPRGAAAAEGATVAAASEGTHPGREEVVEKALPVVPTAPSPDPPPPGEARDAASPL